MKNKLIMGTIAAGVIFSGVSVAASSADDGQGAVKEAESGEANKLSVAEAKDIALAEKDGYVVEVELDEDDGVSYYEMELENGKAEHEIYVHAYTGEVLKTESDGDDDDDREGEFPSDILTTEQAVEIAQAEVDGTVTEMEVDEDDGRYVYEIELGTDNGETELTIDAVTGDVLEIEQDDED
ncbi:PepSY domain-containing protein [Virgibacillus sediminis]|uniref:PepSY domain-containing protein n=1 Tax=Virgibacillus sediminis TaxID=202260 RepID=A0ABV7A4K8_9BACI